MSNIMIIEDNPVHNLLLSHSIEDLNHNPIRAFDLEEARSKLETVTPDLFIIDLQIKENRKPTFAFIKELMKNRHYKDIPIIIVSAYVSSNDISTELPDFKTENTISKPFNVETISTKIKALLKEKK